MESYLEGFPKEKALGTPSPGGGAAGGRRARAVPERDHWPAAEAFGVRVLRKKFDFESISGGGGGG